MPTKYIPCYWTIPAKSLYKVCTHFQLLTTRPEAAEIQLIHKPEGRLGLPHHLEPALTYFDIFWDIVYVLILNIDMQKDVVASRQQCQPKYQCEEHHQTRVIVPVRCILTPVKFRTPCITHREPYVSSRGFDSMETF